MGKRCLPRVWGGLTDSEVREYEGLGILQVAGSGLHQLTYALPPLYSERRKIRLNPLVSVFKPILGLYSGLCTQPETQTHTVGENNT